MHLPQNCGVEWISYIAKVFANHFFAQSLARYQEFRHCLGSIFEEALAHQISDTFFRFLIE